MEEKKHYESLITFLKYTITITGACLTIIISVGIYFTYSNSNQIKEDIANKLKETKDEIKSLNDYAVLNLKETKAMADNAILYIKQDAKNTAINTSKEKVEETFRENNIQELISNTTKNLIELRVNQMIQEQVKKSNEQLMNLLDLMPDFMLAIDKFRAGDKNGLLILDSIHNKSNDQLRIQIADKIIRTKKSDYLISYSNLKNEDLLFLLDLQENKKDSTQQGLKMKLKYIILNDKNLDKVCFATLLLSKYLKKDIELFDFDYVKNLK